MLPEYVTTFGTATIEEYYEFESSSEDKHEFTDGVIVAMTGGSGQHGRYIIRLGAQLENALEHGPCEVYTEVKTRAADSRVYYPDLMVICGGPQVDPADKSGQTYLNPVGIVEVSSPKTKVKDRSEKFPVYTRIPTVRQIVYVDPDGRIDVWTRTPAGTFDCVTRLDGTATVQFGGLDIVLKPERD